MAIWMEKIDGLRIYLGSKEMDLVIDWINLCLAELIVMLFTKARNTSQKAWVKGLDSKINFWKGFGGEHSYSIFNRSVCKSLNLVLFL